MARPIVGDPLRGAQGNVRPAARPVDSFVRPASAPVASTGFEGLAKAMSRLSSGLQKYQIGQLNQAAEQEEIDIDEGKALYAAQELRLVDAIKAGVLPEGANPALMRGFAQADLRTQGADYAASLEEALAKNPELAETSEAYAEWEREQFLDYASENFAGKPYSGADIVEHFMPIRHAARDSLQSQSIKKVAEVRAAERKIQVQNELTRVVDAGIDADLPFETLAASVQVVVGDYLREAPLQGKWVNQTLTDLIAAEALATGDSDVFEVASKIETAPGSFLSGTAMFRKAQEATERKIFERNVSAEKLAHYTYDRIKDERVNALTAQAVRLRTTEDLAKFDAVIDELTPLDPKTAVQMQKLRRDYLDREASPPVSMADENALMIKVQEIHMEGGRNEVSKLTNLMFVAAEQRRLSKEGRRMLDRAIDQAVRAQGVFEKAHPNVTATLRESPLTLMRTMAVDELGTNAENAALRNAVIARIAQIRMNGTEYIIDANDDGVDTTKFKFALEFAKFIEGERAKAAQELGDSTSVAQKGDVYTALAKTLPYKESTRALEPETLQNIIENSWNPEQQKEWATKYGKAWVAAINKFIEKQKQ